MCGRCVFFIGHLWMVLETYADNKLWKDMCYNEIGLCVQTVLVVGLSMYKSEQKCWEGLCDRSKRRRIFFLVSYSFYINFETWSNHHFPPTHPPPSTLRGLWRLRTLPTPHIIFTMLDSIKNCLISVLPWLWNVHWYGQLGCFSRTGCLTYASHFGL